MLDRDKAVLEQGQTQLLADYKVAYERATAQEEAMEVLRGSYIALEHRNAELNAQIESVEALTPEVADNRQQEEAMEVLRASNTALELQNAELRVAAEAAKRAVGLRWLCSFSSFFFQRGSQQQLELIRGLASKLLDDAVVVFAACESRAPRVGCWPTASQGWPALWEGSIARLALLNAQIVVDPGVLTRAASRPLSELLPLWLRSLGGLVPGACSCLCRPSPPVVGPTTHE